MESELAVLFDISNTSERNYSPIDEVDDNIEHAIDAIKDDFNPNLYTLPFGWIDDVDEMLYRQQMIHFYIRDLNVRELTPFYNDNIKTGYIQTIIETVIDGIFDGTVFEQLGDDILDPEAAEDLLFNLLVHGRVLVTKKLDTYRVIPPYRYFRKEDDSVVVYHYTLDNQPLKEEYLQNMCQTYRGYEAYREDEPIESEYFEITMRQLVTDGMLELAMLRSTLYTLLQSDLWGGSTMNFIDEQYLDADGKLDARRVNYTPTQTIENQNPDGAGIKPLWETVTPEIRSSEYQSLLDVIDNTMASLMGMTSEVVGSGNATESQLLSAKTAKKFNKLKIVIQYGLNKMFERFNINKKVDLARYRSDSDEIIIRNAVLVAGSGIGTIKPFLEKLYPELNNADLETLYLKGEMKSKRPLTSDEVERAKELDIYIESQEETADEITTDSEINASELTPVQGVANEDTQTT